MALEELLFYREKQHRVQVKTHAGILRLHLSGKAVTPGILLVGHSGVRVCPRHLWSSVLGTGAPDG